MYIMENVVYETDYAEERRQRISEEHSETSMNVLEKAIESGFFKAYSEAMHSVPKIINPIRKANFEYVQKLCDDMARLRGRENPF